MKRGLAKLEETESAWETLAPGDTFYGTTFAQYKTKIQRSRDVRLLRTNLAQQMSAAGVEQATVDAENLELEKNVARAIGGDPKHEQDSALWEAVGRVRTSERKTGLSRKKKSGETDK